MQELLGHYTGLKRLTDDRISYLAGRIAERRIRDSVLEQLPRREHLVMGDPSISIEVVSPYLKELEELRVLVRSRNLAEIVARYPVREAGIPDAIAKGLQFNSRKLYENAVLAKLSNDNGLRDVLKQRLGAIAGKLV